MTLTELETYLDGFASTLPGLASVEHGDEEEVLNRQNSRIRYPCMWVETPSVALISEPPARQFEFALTFLYNVSKDDNRLARQSRSQALDLAEHAFRKLEDDEESGLFQLDTSRAEGEPILKWSGDRDTGFRFTVRLLTAREDC